jgi:acetolactate synthase-1/2/3 large subunit
MKLSDYVIEFLAARGVRHIFLLPGGGAMHLNDSLARSSSVRHIANLHEQGAAIAAEAYARVTGGLGAVMVTCGPGGTNTVTGVAAAWLDSTPVIFISGQVKRADLKSDPGLRQNGVQEIDIVTIVRSITKYAVTVTDPASIRFHLEKACHLATSGRRGPVWIDLPLDVQGSTIDTDLLEAYEPGVAATAGAPNALTESVKQAVTLLQAARRPVVLLGNGIRLADAIAPMQRWLQQLQAPILTTWLGLDLVPDHDPLLAGRPGGIAPRGANFTLQNCDCFVSVGARLDPIVTAYAHEKFARGARKIVIDIDPSELAKLRFTVDCPVPAGLAEFFQEWERQASREVFPDWQPWRSRCQAWKKKYPLLQPAHLPQKGEAMSMYYFARTLSDLLPENELVVPGSSGFACEIFFLMLEVKPGQRVFHNRGTGSMGFSVPAALGASVAAGGKRVVSVDGDGGFQMNLQELAVIAGLQLPVKFFVINNGGYASIRSSQDNYFQRRHIASDRASGLFLPPLQNLAEAYGVAYRRIEGEENLRENIEQVLAAPGPVVCEVIVRENEPREPRLASFARADGSMVSRPLEDLYPFLDRAEFRENMIVPPLDESLVEA